MVNINKFLDHRGRPIVKKDDDVLNQKIQVEVEVEEEIPNPEYAEYAEIMAWVEENFIDLGLPDGTLWAKKNLGADDEHPNGLRYGICNTIGTTKESDWSEHTICPNGNTNELQSNEEAILHKYLDNVYYYGTGEYTGTIKKEYDAAYAYNKLCEIPSVDDAINIEKFTIVEAATALTNSLKESPGNYMLKNVMASKNRVGTRSVIVTADEIVIDTPTRTNAPETQYIRPIITKKFLENLPPKTIKQTVTKTVEMTVKEYIDMKVAEGNKKPSIVFDIKDILDSVGEEIRIPGSLMEIQPKLNNITVDKIIDNIMNIDYIVNLYDSDSNSHYLSIKFSDVSIHAQSTIDEMNEVYNNELTNLMSIYKDGMEFPIFFTVKNNKIYNIVLM